MVLFLFFFACALRLRLEGVDVNAGFVGVDEGKPSSEAREAFKVPKEFDISNKFERVLWREKE